MGKRAEISTFSNMTLNTYKHDHFAALKINNQR